MTGTSGGLKFGTISLENDQSSVVLSDRSYDIKIPRVPESFSPPAIDPSRNCPLFKAVDNPGNWPEYYFRSEFHGNNRSKTSKYKQHQLPTGAVLFPKNENGERKNANGWENDTKQHRRSTDTANMFPKEMDGKLDANILEKLGLT